ncbi:DUF4397 domain-containing protein [Hymenobacter tibetensis]|uniref:DUF4397 domain-containing protein n=1 Tax=Hymenobacter tibetensis TaxID=497967 RepID=A0ABY4CXS3_9BACT|nr:DUF4397 domain-containing protein [Hymenobacter tibetensis]UOG74319.1 DUF4397 domain-containing protein [Hymenobacter tibetensis]
MKTFSTLFRRSLLLAALPAALSFASCGDDDNPATPAQGRVLISHAAASANVQVTAFVNDQQVGQLNYGQSSNYLNVNAGSPKFRINNGSQVVTEQALTIDGNQSYTVFAYSPTNGVGSAGLLPIQDDLTAPAAGQAKVRVVHLGVDAPSPVRLTLPSPLPGAAGTDVTPDVAFGAASSFVALNAGVALNLTITANGTPRTQVLVVGDGSGSGTGTKTFEAGKIYTVVVRGIAGAAVPTAQRAQAVIIQNN